MSKVITTVALILALGTVAVQAQTKADVKGTLEAKGFKLAAALFDIANITSALNKPAAVYTLLVPNDLAIETFLRKMGLTMDDLKQRPLLAKQLAAGHIILKHNVRAAELFANGNARIVGTLAGKPNDLLFRRLKDGSVKVTDVQGYVANVKNHFVIDDNKVAHPIDKVLLTDKVFYNFGDLCKFRPLTLSSFCRAVDYADLTDTIHGDKVQATLFVPNNKAFARQLDLSGGVVPSVEKVQETLKYHVVPGMKTIGGGFASSLKNGKETVTLFNGHNLTVVYEAVMPAADSTRKTPYATAYVVTEIGQRVPIVKPNVHVGTAVVHGIEFLLLPRMASSGPAAAAASKPSGRRLTSVTPALDSFSSYENSNTRRLLDFGWGMSGGPTAEMDAAEASIEAAVDGQESTAAAADQSLLGAEELSVPGDYDQVENGINPW